MDAANTSGELRCPDCDTPFAPGDNYCRRCGMFVAVERPLPATTTATHAIDVPRRQVPAPIKQAATAVAVGTALHLGASLAGKFLLRQAASAITPRRPAKKQKAALVPREEPQAAGPTAVVTETLLIRRIWIRRD
ncbi:MAG: hypothetical protein Kow0010_22350 [Dehalococcoidia bacterium]